MLRSQSDFRVDLVDANGVQEEAFGGPLNSLNVSNVTDMYYMFNGASAFNQDLSQWCVSNITEHPSTFDLGATNWTLPKPVWGTCPRGENIV